ncbi:TIM barrel protein, partial [Mesorhizobium sp.]|uniref:sugar phosphate isomerase/epimerase family protein n=1 Tax=Mesorhizobium sp. TaxID=1871066 RepID=UPI000FE8F233
MYPAIFARTYPLGPVEQLLSAIRQDGYEGMQFNLSCLGLASLPDSVPAGELTAFADTASERGLAIAGLSGTYNMAHPDVAVRQAARARFANVVAAAPLLGAPIVTLCTGSRNADDMWATHPDNASPAAWADMRVELDAALELAEKHD